MLIRHKFPLAKLVRTFGLLSLLLVAPAPGAAAADQREIDQAIKKGTAALKARYNRPLGAPPIEENPASYGIGPAALTGLALLEAGVPATDPVLKTITEQVRDAAYTQNKTYQVALCLMYLDRRGDPDDVPLIQMLAARLIVGQTKDGGWNYECCAPVPSADEQRLRANLKPHPLADVPPAGDGKGPPKLHPEIEIYGRALVAARGRPAAPAAPGAPAPAAAAPGDISNTQFAVLAVWMSRKHGAPVESTLDLVEKRFVALQDPSSGSWSYHPPVPGTPAPTTIPPGTPAWYCSGLLGISTALARRDERRLKDPKSGAGGKLDPRERVAARAFAGLGSVLADQVRTGQGAIVATGPSDKNGDLYSLWSLERICVIYGVDKVGGVDWYDIGSAAIVRTQSPNGTWNTQGKGPEVNTAFALLFLCKANLARDLTSAEMRAGAAPAPTDLLPTRPSASTPSPTDLPGPATDPAVAFVSKMLKASGPDWSKMLAEARDGKGTSFTRALVLAAEKADGERKKEARDALAERLCRMTAATLRDMLKGNEAELRRAAALACAMKDDKDHIPDLIGALGDTDEAVVRAAKAGLKSLTGKDFGPAAGASAKDRAAAVAAWREWYANTRK